MWQEQHWSETCDDVRLFTIRGHAREVKVDMLQVNKPTPVQRILEQDSTRGVAKGHIDHK